MTVQTTSSTGYLAGTALEMYLSGVKVANGVTDAAGQAVLEFILPAQPGVYPLVVIGGGLLTQSTVEVTAP